MAGLDCGDEAGAAEMDELRASALVVGDGRLDHAAARRDAVEAGRDVAGVTAPRVVPVAHDHDASDHLNAGYGVG